MRQILNSNIDSNWPNIEIDYYKKVELFIDSLSGYQNNESFKILWVKEAESISHFKQIAISNSHLFDAILTYDDEILSKCSNSHIMLFGTSWVHDYKLTNEKEFKISHLTGHKNWVEGHSLRHEIYKNQDNIKTPKDFYISHHGNINNSFNNKILYDSKTPMFNSQFHICIENSKQNNYFSEKLIDCFVTKTIPIYWGCPNISNYFDTRGIFIANNLYEIIDISNNVNSETYINKIEFINNNYELSLPYITIVDRLLNKIKEILI
jgi:hypothetical protein